MRSLAISSLNPILKRAFWLLCLSAAVSAPAGWAAADGVAVDDLVIEQPRRFGFQLGDQFERRIRFRLHHPYELVSESLPAAGRLNRWVRFLAYEIDKVEGPEADDYDITLRYQVVNVETSETDAAVPSHKLKVRSDEETLTFLIPASRTVITPFGETVSNDLADDIAPRLLPSEQAELTRYSTLFALSFAAFCWLQLGRFTQQSEQPFARAYRQLRSFNEDPLNDDDYAEALRRLHEAFNKTAGHTLFPDQLSEFFAAHPGFASLTDEVTDYFARSNAYFFAQAHDRFTVNELAAFAKQCRKIEQGLR